MFEGYLLKFGDTILPNAYLSLTTYTVTPNRRNVIDTFQDSDGLTYRDVAKKYKTKLEFDTVDALKLSQKIRMQQVFKAGLLNERERKYRVTYWNDETNAYEQMECYMSDIDYPIRWIDKNNEIVYGKIRIELTEY